MKFGLIVSKQHPPGVSMVDRFREHVDQVRAARDAGFDLIVMGQHYLSTPFQEIQTMPALARLAAEAGTMRVGATVLLLPLLNPVDVAEQVATLDVITRGALHLRRRARLPRGGVRGVRDPGQGARAPFPRVPGGDQAAVDRGGSDASRPVLPPHQGAHGRQAGPEAASARSGSPRTTTRAVERAARMADAWVINPHATLAVLERQMALYRNALRDAGQAARGRGADHQGAVRRARPPDRHSGMPAVPRGQVQGLRRVGAGQGAARGRQLRRGVRGADARPLHHRRP